MNYGIPCMVSELTTSQLALTDRKEVLIAKDTDEFIRKVIQLYQDEELWYQIQQNALNYIREACNPEMLRTALRNIIEKGLEYQHKF